MTIPTSWLVVGAVVTAAISSAWITAKVKNGEIATLKLGWQRQVADQERQANAMLLEAKEAAAAAERRNATQTAAWEKIDNERTDYINGLRLANGRLVAAHGGLYDRNGRPVGTGGGGGVPDAAGAATGAPGQTAGCVLSEAVSRDLLDLARDADLAAHEAGLGHDLAVSIDQFRKSAQ